MFAVIVLSVLTGCKKEDDDPFFYNYVPPVPYGEVLIPSDVSHTSLVVFSTGKDAPVNGEGEFFLNGSGVTVVWNKDINKPVYLGFKGDGETSFVLGARETAIYLATEAIPFLRVKENKSIIYALKETLYARLPEIQLLEQKVEETVNSEGYLHYDLLEPFLTNARKAVRTITGADKYNNLRTSGDTDTDAGAPYICNFRRNDLECRCPESDSNCEGDHIGDHPEEVVVNRDLFSRYLVYYSMWNGNYDPEANVVDYTTDSESFIGFISPFTLNDFMHNVTNLINPLEYAVMNFEDTPIYQYFNEGYQTIVSGGAYETTFDGTITNLSYSVSSPDDDGMVFLPPSKSDLTLVYNFVMLTLDFILDVDDDLSLKQKLVTELISGNHVSEIGSALEQGFYRQALEHTYQFGRDFVLENMADMASDYVLDYLGEKIETLQAGGYSAHISFMSLSSSMLFAEIARPVFVPIDFDQHGLPPVPSLFLPHYGYNLQNVSETILAWMVSDTAGISFSVYIGQTADDMTLIADHTPSREWEISLDPNTRYFWKVIAHNNNFSTESGLFYFDNGYAMGSQEYVQELLDLGMVMHDGNSPPDLNGLKFVNSPNDIVASNIQGDDLSAITADFFYSIIRPNVESYYVDVIGRHNNDYYIGSNSFVTGSGVNFTVYYLDDGYRTLQSGSIIVIKTMKIVSGTVSSEGIVNFSVGLVMIDDAGDPEGNLISPGSARVFIDGDGLAEYDEWRSGSAHLSRGKSMVSE